ncbi:ester cyclase [Exilibacterium tricleocarpae]|uniref:Ester cyclase n=1 Tax=Exilibacterium tricleocarpae TaxID=2591008 RepID=A0A545TVD7_9GAMM|nr:ester cyclase [Exilibacterium tricleocarpae]TQV81186.1 ester cyclase [Exilibacterium tricleocarpae]
MTRDSHSAHKRYLEPLRRALYDFDPATVKEVLARTFHRAADIHLAYPFDDLDGAGELYARVFAPLHKALPDLERRDTIVIAGAVGDRHWVGCCGFYTGTFVGPWLDIAPTGRQVAMRCHEFFRFEGERVVEMQALWDIPELMMQANAWPMVPALGREWQVPGPATQDGLVQAPTAAPHSRRSLELVTDMLSALGNFAAGGVAAMRLADYWHPRCNWYGPAGIGSARGIDGFRNRHQIPFLNAMPDRVGNAGEGNLFAEGDYVGFTAWPGMRMSITGDGWLGIAPAGQKITLRSLDFWRCEQGMIRENWVLVDLLDAYRQLGVDVFARLREFAKTG